MVLRWWGAVVVLPPEHIRAVRDAVVDTQQAQRTPAVEDNVSSLYATMPLTQDTGITMIGERTNANGSKAFREAMLAGDWETCVDIAKQQTRDGAHMLDLCVDMWGVMDARTWRSSRACCPPAPPFPS